MAKLFEKSVKGLLIDITGVLYDSGHNNAIKGSINAVKLLSERNIPHKFVTNESQVNRDGLVAKLRRAGFDLNPDQILCPVMVCRQYVLSKGLRPHVLVHNDVKCEFEDLQSTEANCVIIGDAHKFFTYDAMNDAFRALMKMKEPLILSMGKGKYYEDCGKLTIDLGAFTAALEYAADAKTVIIGKPSKEYFNMALESLGLKADEVIMVGDDINADIAGAQSNGIRAVLVRSGKYRAERDENHVSIKPNHIVNNLEEIVNMVIKHLDS
ncbi:hypothetical protein B4U80_08711 [Leptotrombidium deliense]|uniref:Phospholysine phosphohistidine inorganic pyrophosphate phosphatase n=1 Tax=Leptotrombidium deliense TaxID=299467 RepID=A0A443S5F0_9ACAR|nr:hypothetical protein B4U80_08711 [Leptotrombidium deliense]